MLKLALAGLAIAVAAATVTAPASAKTFKWASQGEVPTWDPHSQNNALSNGIHAAVYESLVTYNKKFEVEPQLALSWKQEEPTRLRFKLRPNVKFHDGSPFTADDVVFSIGRSMDKASNFTIYTQGIDRAVKVDDLTVDVITKGPNPVLLRQLTEIRMMSRAWADKNKSLTPKDMKTKDENFAHRNANGTGPFMLKEWKPDVRTHLVKNPNWWGKLDSNLTEIIYQPIKTDATRTAALLSGEVDLVLDPPVQDLARIKADSKLQVIDGAENRTIFIGMDQFRDELPGSNVKGKNPFKDRRVRLAMNHAVDIAAINRTIMRGQSEPTGAMVSPQVAGWSKEAHARLAYDPALAKKLLTEAGYGDGFEFTMDCPNNRYINDEEICQALVGMWAKVGLKAKLRTQPMATYFPMIQRYEASVYMLGWGVPTFDALYSLQSLLRSVGAGGDGNYNVGRYSNPQMDALIERAKKETDLATRTQLLSKALLLAKEDAAYIPLHNQVIPWAARKGIELYHRADNRIDMRAVVVK